MHSPCAFHFRKILQVTPAGKPHVWPCPRRLQLNPNDQK